MYSVKIESTLFSFYSQTPEFIRIRKTWEEYKVEYQSSFEKMQEEFTVLIQLVNQGQRLDSLPPAKYSHPPPYPQEAMPTGGNVSQMIILLSMTVIRTLEDSTTQDLLQ